MKRLTPPLRDERCALHLELAMVRSAADAIGTPASKEHVAWVRRLFVVHLRPG